MVAQSQTMRVVRLSTFDRINGASIAAWRLHAGLREAGIDSRMRVQRVLGEDAHLAGPSGPLGRLGARLRPHFERMATLWARRGMDYAFSVNWLPGGSAREAEVTDRADLVHLRWVSGGFLPWGWLRRLELPVVWTCHDQWPFSGAFHYPPTGTMSGCARRLDRWQHQRKRRFWERENRVLVAPSRWMEGCARQAVEAPVVRLPNPIDTTVFRPLDPEDRKRLKAAFGLATDRPTVLFGAEDPSDPRKGGDLLEPIVRRMRESGASFEVAVFGKEKTGDRDRGVHRMGWLGSDRLLADAYAAADVFVLPSRMDNLPNTGVEAMTCGTPVVGSAVGGIGDIVEPSVSGERVDVGSVEGFAAAILRVLKDPGYRTRARAKAESEFSITGLIPRFVDLYAQLLGRSDRKASNG